MKNRTITPTRYYPVLITILTFLAAVGSVYVEWYGDPVVNLRSGKLFPPEHGIAPCSLCWYIRGTIYAIMILTTTRRITRPKATTSKVKNTETPRQDHSGEKTIAVSVIVFCFLGIILGVRKTLLQHGILQQSSLCIVGSTSCAQPDLNYFGFLSLSIMGIIVLSIIILLAWKWQSQLTEE